ncbi:MAG: Fe-S cluster assembly protein HesB [Flavobacterium sp. BFFFF1]|uniref:DNA-3-methyladenine glycosylase family protein n=1 Tax=Flavobacterium sp. BFFFF1 TaxID=2015557 RepID=UPI000BCEEED9|nr:DNA-3-methyladenine glycosylase 2 family protein [Flavobacterium sp. BFFFF1]OYU82151.1 MAG: Fe-S cluster assembly protein HesB [Flavobacterium sp. BFFFF1]
MQQAVNYLVLKDPVFREIIALYGVPEMPKRPPGFETLALLILEQQVSIDSARAVFQKLKSKVSAFTPDFLIGLPDEIYREAGVSRQKTTYIKGLSSAILNNEIVLDDLPSKSPDEIRTALIKLKGIGNWTIDVYLLFCLSAPDIIPLGDIAIINTIKELIDIHTKAEIENYVTKWSPHRSTATFLLWHYYLTKRNRVSGY